MSESPKSATFSRPSLVDWTASALGAGALLGVLLGLAGAAIHRFLGEATAGGERLGASQLVGATLLSAAVSALGLLALASLTWPLLRFRAGRVAALVAHGLLGALFAGAHLSSNVLRAFSGSFLTLGAVDFLTAGGTHLLRTIAIGYGRWVLGLFLIVALIGGAIALWTKRELAPATSRAPSKRRSSQLVRFGVPACVVSAGLLPLGLLPNLASASPEAAFASSMEPNPLEDDAAGEPASETATLPPRPRAPDGPPQTEGERWERLARTSAQRHTNVLVLTLESVSPNHLGYEGYERPTTPNLDRIASSSVRYRRAWSTATHSNYAQMAILSSLFPRRTAGLDTYRRLDYPRVLLHDVFTALGYATATISSQDEAWQGMLRFQQTATPTYFRHAKDYAGLLVDIGSELVVQDHVTADLALDWVGKHTDKPWSLYVNFQATHFPYRLNPGMHGPFQPTQTTRGRFNYLGYPEQDREAAVNRYDNALSYVDQQIGKLEKGLKRLGALDDTIWVITSDHGESFHDHGQVTHGKTLFDSEARIPLLVHWPAKLKPADVEEPVSSLDVLPTILDLLEVPPHPAFQGKSFASPSTRTADPPAIYMNIQGLRSAEAIVCWPWKLIVDRSAKSTHLFHLERDPGELEDLAKRDSVVADRLRATLSAQVSAQMSYHHRDNPALKERYAPRLLACPALPEVQRAAATPDSTPRPAPARAGDPLQPAPGAARPKTLSN